MAQSEAVLLDASTVIALARHSGAEIVYAAVSSGVMNAVNAAPCVLVFGRTGSTALPTGDVASLAAEIVPCHLPAVVAAADNPRHHPV